MSKHPPVVVGEPKPFWRADEEKDRWQRQLQLLIDTSKSNVSVGQPLKPTVLHFPFVCQVAVWPISQKKVAVWPWLARFHVAVLFFSPFFPLISTRLLAPDVGSVFRNNDNVNCEIERSRRT